MAKITGAAAELQIGAADDGGATAAGGDTFDAIGGVRSISGPNGEKPEIDVTELASTGKEYLGGIPDYGQVQFQGWHNENEAEQTTVWGDFLDASDQHIRNYKIVFNDGTEYVFQGFVQALEHTGIENEAGVEFNGTIRISGGITRTISTA